MNFTAPPATSPIMVTHEHQHTRYDPAHRWLLLLLLVLVASMTAVQPAHATAVEVLSDTVAGELSAERTSPPDYAAVSSGTLYLEDVSGYVDAPLLQSAVHMSISGIVARVSMEQSFANNSANWVEGIYVFPLPDNAAVNAMNIRVGQRTIKGRIAEKSTAEAAYQQAKESGQVASLVRQERPNLFTSRIANIAPGEAIEITLTYVQTIDYRHERFSLTFPMTLTPRYSNTSVADAAAITPPQDHARAITGPATTLQIDFPIQQALAMISSPSHQITLTESAATTTLALPGPVPMDRDFVLQWSPANGSEPTVSTWQEQVEGRDYLLAMVTPPQVDATPVRVPRELILVIDTSGSMAGQSIAAAQKALHSALDGLNDGDRFNIIGFESRTYNLFPTSRTASAEQLTQARRFIQTLQADGGTEMSEALRRALANPVEGYLRQVVFVTDGSVGNEDQLFTQIKQQLRHARLFTVGIGSAPNDWFMKKAAQAGRGTFTFVPDTTVAQEKMRTLFQQLESPALTDLKVEWFGDTADVAPAPLQDLYLGEPLIFSAELGHNTTGFRLRGMHGNTPWEQETALEKPAGQNSGLSTVWARQKISSLLDQQRQAGQSEQFKPLITQVALAHQLVSPYTSFIAVDETPVRFEGEPLEQTRLTNLMPAGSAMQPISMPSGAAGIDTLWLFSFLCASLALFLSRLPKRKANP